MTTEQRTIAVDAAALAELRQAYRAYQEAREWRKGARTFVGGMMRGEDAQNATTAFQRAAEAFVAGLERTA